MLFLWGATPLPPLLPLLGTPAVPDLAPQRVVLVHRSVRQLCRGTRQDASVRSRPLWGRHFP